VLIEFIDIDPSLLTSGRLFGNAERNMSDMFTVLSQTDLICILVFMTTCMQLRRGVVVTADGLFALEPPVPEQASRQPRELVVRGLGLASQFIRVPPTVRDVLEDGCKAVAGVAHRAALTHVERSTCGVVDFKESCVGVVVVGGDAQASSGLD